MGVLLGQDSDFRAKSGYEITFSQSSGWTSVTDSSPYTANTYDVTSPSPASWVVGINTLYMGGCIIVSRDYRDTALTSVITLSEFSGTLEGATFASMGLTGNEWFQATWDTASGTDYISIATVGVPEPASCACLFGLGGIGLVAIRRRFQSRA